MNRSIRLLKASLKLMPVISLAEEAGETKYFLPGSVWVWSAYEKVDESPNVAEDNDEEALRAATRYLRVQGNQGRFYREALPLLSPIQEAI